MKALVESTSLRRAQSRFTLLVRVALIGFASLVQPVVSCAQTSLEIQVNADSDDAEEDDTGGVSLNDATLDLGQSRWVGFRFNSVTIPQGATISSAYIEMRATGNNSESTDLTILGEDADDAATFNSGSTNLSTRPMTVASLNWSNIENWLKDQLHDTPDIAPIVQEIIDRSGWADGNNLVILIRSDDLNGKRLAFSHDDNGNKAAKLHLEYVVSTSGLLGHWAFDESIGSTASDSSASANDATLQGGATWISDCSGTSAIEFDGLGASSITAQPFSPPSTGTVAFWMRSAGAPAAQSCVFGVGDGWEARQETDGTLSFDLGAEGSPGFVTLASLDQIDRWYHVVAVFDTADDSFQVYVDGKLDTSGINGEDMVAQSAGQLSFGTRTGSTDYWKGALRDFRIYGTKLTAEEVAELYGIIAHWKLDESTGSAAIDSSGRGNDATFVGSPTLGVNGAFPGGTNTAVQLDGTSQHVTAGASLLNDLEQFTLAGWIRPNSVLPDISLFGQNDLIELGIESSTNQLDFWTANGGSISATGYLPLGKWTHVTAVGDGVGLALYIDGVEVATGGTSTVAYGSNSEVFKIGEGVLAPSGDFFDGRVDDVRVYSRPMCPEEVRAIYKGGRPPGVRIIKWLEVR